jgi:hypothetical protein
MCIGSNYTPANVRTNTEWAPLHGDESTLATGRASASQLAVVWAHRPTEDGIVGLGPL